MNIVFICSSLEPGFDGVGDYTALLAGQLASNGDTCTLIGFFDAHIENIVETSRKSGGIELQVFRFSKKLSLDIRVKCLKEILCKVDPEVISLQYVPYGFNKYGIPLTLSRKLSGVTKTAKWHVMVHEPFITPQDKSLKNAAIKRAQIVCLQRIRQLLKPICIHTSIRSYQQLLNSIGIKSKLLGLFGNIPVPTNTYDATNEKNTFVYFGTLPNGQYQKVMVDKMIEYYNLTKSSIHLILCGKNGKYLEAFIQRLGEYPSCISYEVLGTLDTREIGKIFNRASAGISRVPAKLIGKSGTAIAMLEYGLPLWVPVTEKDSDIEDVEFRPELCFFDLSKIELRSNVRKPINRLALIANQLISDIKMTKHGKSAHSWLF